ncbi:MAG: acetyl-CoA carboxylase carboxyltransferase subunit alpha [Candidatus Izimaplasma sp.]|nr:acetyl-CoA carboxylase carboxyltransferase subunit alpha [Candidatus Izimaplasma bacterium]
MDVLQKLKKLEDLNNKVNELDDDTLIQKLKTEIEEYKQTSLTQLTAWDRVLLARHKERPHALEFIEYMTSDFLELKGDRLYKDDASIIGGIGNINGEIVTIIALQKGYDTDDNIKRNFAMPHPEGYRKAKRLMDQAEKFNRPIITLIDTPGAYPGLGAEERGQGEAIAQNLRAMSEYTVPIISVVIGEGGSGGALALGVANKILMLENAVYSILSPEGYASILWKDAKRAKEAAEVMKLTSFDLKELKIIDMIIQEPIGGAHFDKHRTLINTKEAILTTLSDLKVYSKNKLKTNRHQKYRNIGFFQRFNYDNLGGIKR